jgi:hypothetical protein
MVSSILPKNKGNELRIISWFLSTYNILELKARFHQKPSRMKVPRTSFKRPDLRMNIDWRTTKDQDYNMDRGVGIQWVQPTEPCGHMIQYSQLRLLESKRFHWLNPLNSGLPVHIGGQQKIRITIWTGGPKFSGFSQRNRGGTWFNTLS